MTDDEKQNKKADGPKSDAVKTSVGITHDIDIAGETYKAGMASISPSLDASIYNAAKTVSKIGETADLMMGHSAVADINIVGRRVTDSGFGLDHNEVIWLPRVAPLGNLHENPPTLEEIEKLIEKKLPSKKDDGLKKEQVIEIFNEITEGRNRQENENILAINKKGLDLITKELLTGKERDWRCAKCGKPLEIFKSEEGIEKIKKYLVDFRNNIPKKCANGHDNWFELKEDGINWVVKVIYEKEFRLKS